MKSALVQVDSEIRVLPAPARAMTVDDLPLIGPRLCARIATGDEVLKVICERYKISRRKLTARNRRADVMPQRFLAYFLLWNCAGMGLNQIGRVMRRDHGAVRSGLRTFVGWIQTEPGLKEAVKQWLLFFIKRPAGLAENV